MDIKHDSRLILVISIATLLLVSVSGFSLGEFFGLGDEEPIEGEFEEMNEEDFDRMMENMDEEEYERMQEHMEERFEDEEFFEEMPMEEFDENIEENYDMNKESFEEGYEKSAETQNSNSFGNEGIDNLKKGMPNEKDETSANIKLPAGVQFPKVEGLNIDTYYYFGRVPLTWFSSAHRNNVGSLTIKSDKYSTSLQIGLNNDKLTAWASKYDKNDNFVERLNPDFISIVFKDYDDAVQTKRDIIQMIKDKKHFNDDEIIFTTFSGCKKDSWGWVYCTIDLTKEGDKFELLLKYY